MQSVAWLMTECSHLDSFRMLQCHLCGQIGPWLWESYESLCTIRTSNRPYVLQHLHHLCADWTCTLVCTMWCDAGRKCRKMDKMRCCSSLREEGLVSGQELVHWRCFILCRHTCSIVAGISTYEQIRLIGRTYEKLRQIFGTQRAAVNGMSDSCSLLTPRIFFINDHICCFGGKAQDIDRVLGEFQRKVCSWS